MEVMKFGSTEDSDWQEGKTVNRRLTG